MTLNRAIKIINKYNCIKDTIERAISFWLILQKIVLEFFKDSKYTSNVLINLINSSISRIQLI